MFDVSLGELLLIGAVTLVVVGPEKMPKVARTAGMLFGRLQRFVNNVKVDLQREMQASELAQIQKEIEAEATEIKNSIHQPLEQTQQAMNQLEADFQASPQSSEQPHALSSTPAENETESVAPHREPVQVVDDKQLDLFADTDDAPARAPTADRR